MSTSTSSTSSTSTSKNQNQNQNEASTTKKKRAAKIVFVGDHSVGKTSAMIAFVRGKFPVEFIPSCLDTVSIELERDHRLVTLELWFVLCLSVF